MITTRIWSGETYSSLYFQLVKKFGPLSGWRNSRCPSEAKREAYEAFLTSFAKVIGAKSARAVQQQIEWAVTRQETGASCSLNALLFRNKTYALDAGFITHDLLPTYSHHNYREPSKLKMSSRVSA